jgi:hypothetical protein
MSIRATQPGPARPWHGPALARLVPCRARPGTMTPRAVLGQPTGCRGGPGTGPRANFVPGQPAQPDPTRAHGRPAARPTRRCSSMEAGEALLQLRQHRSATPGWRPRWPSHRAATPLRQSREMEGATGPPRQPWRRQGGAVRGEEEGECRRLR